MVWSLERVRLRRWVSRPPEQRRVKIYHSPNYAYVLVAVGKSVQRCRVAVGRNKLGWEHPAGASDDFIPWVHTTHTKLEVLVFIFLLVQIFVVVVEDVVHEAVVGAALAANDETVGATDKSTVGQLAGALFVVAAAVAERDQALAEVVAARHRRRLYRPGVVGGVLVLLCVTVCV